MSIFIKKYDYLKDSLSLKFNGTNYELYYENKLLESKNLSNRTKKFLLNKNKELLTNKDLLMRELNDYKIKKRMDIMRKNGYIFSSTQIHLSNTIDGTMSSDLSNYLEPLVNDENIILGISRIHDVKNNQIEDILLNGLIMNGHLGGAVNAKISLNDNVAFYPENKSVINELMFANEYKNSNGCILIRIPNNVLEKELYYINDGLVKLKPKYILGYIPVNNNHIETIISASDINKTILNRINEEEPYVMGETINSYLISSKVK